MSAPHCDYCGRDLPASAVTVGSPLLCGGCAQRVAALRRRRTFFALAGGAACGGVLWLATRAGLERLYDYYSPKEPTPYGTAPAASEEELRLKSEVARLAKVLEGWTQQKQEWAERQKTREGAGPEEADRERELAETRASLETLRVRTSALEARLAELEGGAAVSPPAPPPSPPVIETDPTLDRIRAGLTAEDPRERWSALLEVVGLPSERVAPLGPELVRLLADDLAYLRAGSARAIANAGLRAAAEPLLARLEEEESLETRAQMAQALGLLTGIPYDMREQAGVVPDSIMAAWREKIVKREE